MSEEQSRRSGLTWWMRGAILLPAAYVFSIGPAATYAARLPPGTMPPPAMIAGYAPIEWLGQNTPLGVPLRWYVNLWR